MSATSLSYLADPEHREVEIQSPESHLQHGFGNHVSTSSRQPRHPESGHTRVQREQAEKLQQAREEKEKHLYTVIKAARDQDMRDQIGSSLFWDLVDFDKVRHSLRICE